VAVNDKRFTQVPPRATGDRIHMVHTAEIQFSGGTGPWTIGQRYTITGGGGPTMSVHVHGVQGSNSAGHLSVHYTNADKYNEIVPIAGQDIQDPENGNAVVGTVVAAYDVYIPANNIMGYDNPEYGLDIDRFGSAQITFAEGSPEITEFGELRSSNKTLLAQYSFTKSRLPDEFSNALIGAGSLAFKSGYQAVELSVGDTLNDQATHTSNVYHPYIPGATNLLFMATRIGDAGQTGLVRNWGMFDATDGFFFQLNGTALRVVHRYTFNGTTTNSAVEQADWSGDPVDGTGGSGFNLDVTKNNIYWVDFQYIGGGRIRWGVYYEGERIVCHEMNMSNGGGSGTFLHNAVGNPNRPICWATKCITAGGYTGTKTMYAYGAAVWAEGLGNTNIMEEGDVRAFDDNYTITENSPYTQGAYYLYSLRPLEQIPDEEGNDQENHSLYLPKYLTVDAYDETGADVRGELRIFSQCILRGSSFASVDYTTTEVDEYAQHVGHGPEIYRKPVNGPSEIDFTKIFTTIQNGSLKVNAETSTSVRQQTLTRVLGTDDPFSDGVSSVVTIKVGLNPIYLSKAIHFFADRQAVEISGLSANGPNGLNGNTYYLSLQNSTEAQIYSTLNALDDDRIPRVLSISGLAGGTIDVGDVLTISGAGTCTVHSVSGSDIRVETRTNAALDVGLTAASGSTDGGSTTFTVDSVALANNTTSSSSINYYLPYDRYTLLGAESGSGWSTSSEGDGTTDIGQIEGTPPTQPTWTFMWAPRVQPTGAGEHSVRINLQWKERIQ